MLTHNAVSIARSASSAGGLGIWACCVGEVRGYGALRSAVHKTHCRGFCGVVVESGSQDHTTGRV
jgi:hypothetical protein